MARKSTKTKDFVLPAEKMAISQSESFVLRNKVYLFHEDEKTEVAFRGDVNRALKDLQVLNAGWEHPRFNENWFLFVLERHYGYRVKT